MKNQRSSPLNGLLAIKTMFAQSQGPADVPIERTFSNESTIEKDRDIIKYPPRSPTSVTQCDIFRPLREAFFSFEMEEMLTLKRATPVCCGSLLDVDDDDKEEEKGVATVPLVRQDALEATLESLERDEAEDDDETLFGERIMQEQGCVSEGQ